MIKGHTKIELTDTHTGEKQTLEHDNMLTNAVTDLTKTVFNTVALNVLSEGDRNIAQNMFGAIAIFENAQNDNANDYMLPSDNKLIGFADDTSYNGIDTQRGSYNITESGAISNGYKHVWDFTTSQANGTISSVSLMPRLAGKFGCSDIYDSTKAYNFPIWREIATPTASYMTFFSPVPFYVKSNGDAFAFNIHNAVITRDTEYANEYMKNTGKLQIIKGSLPLSGARINSSLYKFIEKEVVEIDIPESFLTQLASSSSSSYYTSRGIMATYQDGILTIYPDVSSLNSQSKFTAIGSTLEIIQIDLEDNFKVTQKTITNTATEALVHSSSSSIRTIFYPNNAATEIYYPDYSLVTGASGALYILNTNDPTDIKRVVNADGTTEMNYTARSGMYHCFRFGEFLFFSFYSTTSAKYRLLNLKSGKLYNTCYTETDMWNLYSGAINTENPCIKVPPRGTMSSSSSSSSSSSRVAVVPWVLCTKNNLATPVVKTANHSMKITYTLTETE